MASKTFIAGIISIILFGSFIAYADCSSHDFLFIKLDPTESPPELWAFKGVPDSQTGSYNFNIKKYSYDSEFICGILLTDEEWSVLRGDKRGILWAKKGSILKKNGKNIKEDIGTVNYHICSASESGGDACTCNDGCSADNIKLVIEKNYGSSFNDKTEAPKDTAELSASNTQYKPKYDILCGDDGKWHVCDEVGCVYGDLECLEGNVWGEKKTELDCRDIDECMNYPEDKCDENPCLSELGYACSLQNGVCLPKVCADANVRDCEAYPKSGSDFCKTDASLCEEFCTDDKCYTGEDCGWDGSQCLGETEPTEDYSAEDLECQDAFGWTSTPDDCNKEPGCWYGTMASSNKEEYCYSCTEGMHPVTKCEDYNNRKACEADGQGYACDIGNCEWDSSESKCKTKTEKCADACPDAWACAGHAGDLETDYPSENYEIVHKSDGDDWCSDNEGKSSCFCISEKATTEEEEEEPTEEEDGTGDEEEEEDGGSGSASGALSQIKGIVWCIACYVYCIVLFIVGSIVALVLIFSGIKWFTSDDESGRSEAKRRIAYAIAGLAIVVIACPLIDFLFEGTSVTEVKKCSDCNCGNIQASCEGVSIGEGGVSKPGVSKAEAEKETCESSAECEKLGNYYCYRGTGKCMEQKKEYDSCSASMEMGGIADKVCKGELECISSKCAMPCEHSSECVHRSGLFCNKNRYCKDQVEEGDACSDDGEIDGEADNMCESGLECIGGECQYSQGCTKSSYCRSHARDFGYPSGESYCSTASGGTCLETVDEGSSCSAAQVKDGEAKYMCSTDWCIDGICREKGYCKDQDYCDIYEYTSEYYCDTDENKCYAKKSANKPCTKDYECKSGTCKTNDECA